LSALDDQPATKPNAALVRAAAMLAADPQRAELEIRAHLRSNPGDLNAVLLLGRALLAQGRAQSAIDALLPLMERHPDFAIPAFEIARAQIQLGRSDQAIANLRRAVRCDPNLPGALLSLGDLLWETSDLAGADKAYGAHIAMSANAGYAREAMAALRADEPERAADIVRAQLKMLPTDVAAKAVLGEALARQGALADAEAYLAECTRRVPSFAAARSNHAAVLSRQMKYREAVEQTEQLIALEPSDLDYRLLHAMTLSQAGRVAEALACYEQLLAEFPDEAKAWWAFGNALRGVGKGDEAVQAYRRGIAAAPSGAEGYWCIANLKTAAFTADDLRAMEAQLARSGIGDEDRRYLEFALATALEGDRRFDEAFAHFRNGNALKRARLQFDAAQIRDRFRSMKRALGTGVFAQRQGWGDPAADPIFIVGLPRSGSTLVEQILASHSGVEGTTELPDIQDIVRELQPRGSDAYPEILTRMSARELQNLGGEYMSRTRRHRRDGIAHFTDKMPANFEHVGLIKLILPNARIIDARRHPLGCCVSNYRQLYFAGNSFSYDLQELGLYYRAYVELMAHFDLVLPGSVHRVVHEDLIADPEREIRRMLEFCGLEFESACVEFHRTERPVRTVSSEQVRRPIFADGVDHWRNYEPWLAPLKVALGDVLTSYPGVPRDFGAA
jgi:tetratricopeptide (TPR) repeat protein